MSRRCKNTDNSSWKGLIVVRQAQTTTSTSTTTSSSSASSTLVEAIIDKRADDVFVSHYHVSSQIEYPATDYNLLLTENT